MDGWMDGWMNGWMEKTQILSEQTTKYLRLCSG
jgi:hypothetical protein